MSTAESKVPYIRLDDYGLITYLKMVGYDVIVNKSNLFEVQISPNNLEKEISKYKNSEFKVFDETGKALKKTRKSSQVLTPTKIG